MQVHGITFWVLWQACPTKTSTNEHPHRCRPWPGNSGGDAVLSHTRKPLHLEVGVEDVRVNTEEALVDDLDPLSKSLYSARGQC